MAVPISGGLDSRSTVAALTRTRASACDANLWFYSYGYTGQSIETRIARQIARARGIPITTFVIEPYLLDRINETLATTEGYQDVTQHRQTFIADALAENADYVLAAHWGDVWLDDMGVASDTSSGRIVDIAARKIQKRGRAWLLETVCAPRIGGDAAQLVRGSIEDGFAELAHIKDPDFRLKAFKTEHWSFRWTLASIRAFQEGAFPRLPFYDTRLADFLASVPTDQVRGRRLQIDYLKRYAPDLARITWQARDANLYAYEYARLWRYPRGAVRKAWRIVHGAHAIQRNWEAQFLAPGARARLERWLLEPGLELHEHVPARKIAALLDAFYAVPDAANGYTVSMLLTFSAWLELHHRG
jgi:hypothetical protein